MSIPPAFEETLDRLSKETSDPDQTLALLTSTTSTHLDRQDDKTNGQGGLSGLSNTSTTSASQLLKEHPTRKQMLELQKRQETRIKDAVESHIETKADCEKQLEKLKLEYEMYNRMEKNLKKK